MYFLAWEGVLEEKDLVIGDVELHVGKWTCQSV